MNRGLFRLVFSKHLGMLVPASEAATSHASPSASGARMRRRALYALIAASFVPHAYAADIVPLPSSGLVKGGGTWTNADIVGATPTITTIQQRAPQAIANWLKFNLAADHTLDIKQQAGWSMLHRIHDQDPSIIAGTITGQGNNYFLNSNGIVFTGTAQVSLGSIWAMTATNMTDDLFNQGFINNLAGETFSNTGGFIRVEAGAQLTAATGGKVVLFAKDVENHGVITTKEGQTILAAGEKVYLKSTDELAGMLVEVDGGGTATNLGKIVADRGNVTLIGLAVNQQGRISASTSVRANGSIHLLARDSVLATNQTLPDGSTKAVFQAQRYGTVTIGEGSVTEVTVETADKEAVNNQVNLQPSTITVQGRSIDINGQVSAKGGVINVNAREDVNPGATLPIRVMLGNQAKLDVSGVDAEAPMSRNQLAIRFYSEEAKNTPMLKGSPLLGQTIFVDARKGTDLFDIQPYLDGIERTISERMSAGGTVNITSAGDIITKQGSVIDVSGGVINYLPGVIQESIMLINGRAVAISQADRVTPYRALGNTATYTDPKSGMTRVYHLDTGIYQQGYIDGADAGTINMTSSGGAPILDGDMVATTRHDIVQRTNLPDGGKFNLTTGDLTVRVADKIGAASAAMTMDSANSQQSVVLDTSLLERGFNHLGINSMGLVSVDKAITTEPNGSVSLKGGQVAINRNISTPGGNITIDTQTTSDRVQLADNVVLSAAGTWVNDNPRLQGSFEMPIALNGGNISIKGGEIDFGQNTLLDTSAGAWVESTGKTHLGNGGNIALETGGDVTFPAQMRAYGFNKGGELSLSTPRNIQIGGQDPGVGFWLPESFFEQNGFSKYRITSTGDDSQFVIGDPGGAATVIHPKMQTLQLTGDYAGQLSASQVGRAVATPVMLAEGQRAPTSVEFSAYVNTTTFGSLTLLENATIRTDSPDLNGNVGTISLNAGKQLTVLGKLIAQGGTVTLNNQGAADATPYDNSQSIWLGERSLIDVSGYYARSISPSGELLSARVYDAGDVNITAQRGFVVAKEGSVIKTTGASGLVQIGGDSRASTMTYGAAGDIAISARDGVLWDGSFVGGAQGTGARGAFSLSLVGNANPVAISPAPPTSETVLTVTTQQQNQAQGLNVRDSLASFEGKAQISTDQLNQGGFDHIALKSVSEGRASTAPELDRIQFADGVKLAARDTVLLDSSRFSVMNNGVVDISASHITFSSLQASDQIVAGTGLLRANADWIDLSGTLNFSGVNRVELNSRLDIRTRGLTVDNTGYLRTPGELSLKARQIYPVTNSAYTLEAMGADSKISIGSSGEAPKAVYSAGGKLTLKAKDIDQGGVIRAPIGEINLNAEENLTLRDGSLTTTSAEGLVIPYGSTLDGGNVWNLPGNVDLGKKPMEKSINLNAKNINMASSGAVVDVSGGGDTFAYEFINGLGGSVDILVNKPNTYALMPGMQGEYSPYDYTFNNYGESAGHAPALGQSVYISGAPGLPAGYYTLMPARYALLKGAYLVEVDSTRLVPPGQSSQLADGSYLSSGYFGNFTGSSRDANWTAFRLTDGLVFRDPGLTSIKLPAEYRISSGNEFFAQQAVKDNLAIPRLAMDAGQLMLAATERLTLGATLKSDVAEGSNGRGALVDIVSNKINVVASVGADDGTLQISADALSQLNAESILLGGRRSQGAEATEITTVASEVSINNAGHALTVNELLVTANDNVHVASGAEITTHAADSVSSSRVRVNGDGALFAVSGRHNIEYDRVNASANPVTGNLDIADGSNISAHESLVLDATGTANLAGEVRLLDKIVDGAVVAHGNVTLGANSILLGEAPQGVNGMRVDNSLLESFGNLQRVTLTSRQNVNLYGNVSVDNPGLDVTINAGGIAGHALAGNEQASLNVNNLTLKNTAGASFVAPVNQPGSSLAINANSLVVEGVANTTAAPAGAGKFTIGGYEQLSVTTSGDAVLSGTGSMNLDAQQVTLANQRITAATSSDFAVNVAQGHLSTTRNGNPPTEASTGLGAKLALNAQSMTLGGDIDLLSGQIKATTTQGDLRVVSGARMNAGSSAVNFDKYTAYTPAGQIALQANLANIVVDAGAALHVDGGAGGNAGTISMTAQNGQVSVADGTLHGQAGAGMRGGSFVLDSATVNSFSVLNAALNAGGFDASRNLRLRQGDLQIAAGDTVKASNITLSTDNGSIDIAGTLDASGARGGKVKVYAKNDLTLRTGSQLLAKAEAADGEGGDVLLSAETGELKAEVLDGSQQRLTDAALIDVSGVSGGTVTLRAGRVGAAGLRVEQDATAAIRGASKAVLESVNVINGGAILNGTTLTQISNNTSAFYANAGAVADSYAATQDGLSAIVTPHTELRINGDTELSTDWNLNALSQGREGSLTIRSSGNLQLNGTLSDGFSGLLATSALATGSSWNINLVAGADLAAANTMAVKADNTQGNITLGNAKMIRTGTGDINIAASGKLNLGNAASVIYTAGRKADDLAGFTNPATALLGTTGTAYLTDGGDISIATGSDITGALLAVGGNQQLMNSWMFRQGGGNANLNGSWWLRTQYFKQGVAAFGGGDVDVSSGGNVTNLSVAVPTTGRYVDASTSRIDGGGNIHVAALGDIVNGVYYAGRGDISLNAGGSVAKAGNTFGTVIALQDATAKVSAVKDVFIEAAFNPTLMAQSLNNTPLNALIGSNNSGVSAFFNTYSAKAALSVAALTGNVTFADADDTSVLSISSKLPTALADGSFNSTSLTSSRSTLAYLPGTVDVTAFNGDITAAGGLITMPSAQGNLKLLAANNIQSSWIVMSDADVARMPTPLNPTRKLDEANNVIGRLNDFVIGNHAEIPVYSSFREEAAIVARDGSIGSANTTTHLLIPKAVSIVAGQDIFNLNSRNGMTVNTVRVNGQLQNLATDDLTMIKAGRDFLYTTGNSSGLQFGGPGNVLVQAGRNLNLGAGQGLNSVANTVNGYLPDTGSSLTILAGVGQGPRLAAYIAQYIDPQGAGPAVLAGNEEGMSAYRSTTAKSVGDYMRQLRGDPTLSDADAMHEYLALDHDKQAVFAYRHYSSELRASGEADVALLQSGEDITGIQRHKRGDDAVAALFPRDATYQGDLTLYDSRIRTVRDGSIDILVPGGMVVAGIPGRSVQSDSGIVTEAGGAIRAFAETDFQVNQSRVVTQYGSDIPLLSDIVVWVNNGNIDAGKGSRSVVAVPEVEIQTDVFGNTIRRTKGSSSGSGIQAQSYDPDGPTGPLEAPEYGTAVLVAPRGILDAGEAGITGGRIIVVAQQVNNAGNIVGTSTVGVPLATVGSLAGTVSGASNVAGATTASLGDLVNLPPVQAFSAKNLLPSFISVEVLGIGNILK